MSTTKKTDIINSLLDLPEFEPETSAVHRFGAEGAAL